MPSSGDLLNLGIELISPTLAGGCFTTEPPGKPHTQTHTHTDTHTHRHTHTHTDTHRHTHRQTHTHTQTYTHTHTYIHTCVTQLLKKKNEISPFVTSCVDLESIRHSKISQTEKGK